MFHRLSKSEERLFWLPVIPPVMEFIKTETLFIRMHTDRQTDRQAAGGSINKQ